MWRWVGNEPPQLHLLMQSHILLLTLFAFFVSLVFAVIAKDSVPEQLQFGGLLFGGFLLSAFVLGWLMYPFPL
jgi:hypothetical protein